MATDIYLLDRMRNILRRKGIDWIEKRMFGGDCFMVDDKMLIGTYKGGIMARVAPEESENLLERPGTSLMVLGGREMKGFVFLQPEAYDQDSDLEFWIERCLVYNPIAKSSKKKK